MATFMGSKGGFQLCDKRTTYVQVSGVLSQVRLSIVDNVSYQNLTTIIVKSNLKTTRHDTTLHYTTLHVGSINSLLCC